jgi:gamma-glutamyl phosphate reductase
MTGEEMERAIEFLLKNQSSYESRFDQLTQQISETNKQLQMHAETQTELIQIVIRNTEEQRQFNTEFRAGLRSLAAAQTRTDENLRHLAAAQGRTDETVNRLAATVQHFLDGQSHDRS